MKKDAKTKLNFLDTDLNPSKVKICRPALKGPPEAFGLTRCTERTNVQWNHCSHLHFSGFLSRSHHEGCTEAGEQRLDWTLVAL
jgi:hypothetical protein